MDQITNIEALRDRFRKKSLLNNRSGEERKEILYTWRDCLSREERRALTAQVNYLVDNQKAIGKLSALELIFKLTEFVSFVESEARHKPGKEG